MPVPDKLARHPAAASHRMRGVRITEKAGSECEKAGGGSHYRLHNCIHEEFIMTKVCDVMTMGVPHPDFLLHN
jgi:hypothetical protein